MAEDGLGHPQQGKEGQEMPCPIEEDRETLHWVHEGKEKSLEVQGISNNFPNAEGDYLVGGTTSSMLEDCLPTLSLEEDRTTIGSHEELKDAMFCPWEVEVPMLPMQYARGPTLAILTANVETGGVWDC